LPVLLGGAVVVSAMMGFAVYGAIGDKYKKLGGAGGALGAPMSDEAAAPHGGRFNNFQNGSIYWHPSTGAFAVLGSIGQKRNQLGRVAYGYPITDESATPGGSGRYNHFRAVHMQGKPESSIYYSARGTFAVYGAIRGKWASEGWEQSWLGYPTSDEHQSGNYRVQNFERGIIRWSPKAGAELLGLDGKPPADPCAVLEGMPFNPPCPFRR
jgi:uncharacterized protein with LGFP repeats